MFGDEGVIMVYDNLCEKFYFVNNTLKLRVHKIKKKKEMRIKTFITAPTRINPEYCVDIYCYNHRCNIVIGYI